MNATARTAVCRDSCLAHGIWKVGISQNRHGEGLHHRSLAARIAAIEREGDLPRILFLQEIRHNIYQGNIQKSSRSEREDPGYRFPYTNTESFCYYCDKTMGENREGKDDMHMGTTAIPILLLRGPGKPYLLLWVTERILQSRLLESPPELWKAASWLHSSGQSQPEVRLRSLQPKQTKS